MGLDKKYHIQKWYNNTSMQVNLKKKTIQTVKSYQFFDPNAGEDGPGHNLYAQLLPTKQIQPSDILFNYQSRLLKKMQTQAEWHESL